MDQALRLFPKLDALEDAARRRGPLRVAVAYPCSVEALSAALAARDDKIIEPVLVGPRRRIRACADSLDASLDGVTCVEAEDDPVAASRLAVAMVGAGEAQALMKGSQHSDELLGAALSREANLRTGRRMRAIEIAPEYVDVALRRWRKLFPDQPVKLDGEGQTFEAVAHQRGVAIPADD